MTCRPGICSWASWEATEPSRCSWGAAEKDHFYWSQEAYDKACRPHLLVRAGDGPARHMQIHQDHFVALYFHLGPHSPKKWWPSLGTEVDGLVGINWKNKETGLVLVDKAPPVG